MEIFHPSFSWETGNGYGTLIWKHISETSNSYKIWQEMGGWILKPVKGTRGCSQWKCIGVGSNRLCVL